jgi:ribosomal protein S8E
MAELEIKNNVDDFAEKLKNAESVERKEKHGKDELEKMIKRNQEMVHESEAMAVERAQELVSQSIPNITTVKEDDKKEPEKATVEKQKEHVKFHAKDIASFENPEDQITKIVELASKKDPYFAIKVARHIDNNYILDRVHDGLIESQVREALIEKGLLEEIR